MNSSNIVSGKNGEDAACIFLLEKGYKILERNFQKRYGEIDIVALDKSNKNEPALVFVEVKTRTSLEFGNPLEAITPWKLKSVVKTVDYYILTHKNVPDLLRIDAIAVYLNSNGLVQNIEHVKNITE
ncbi:MAG: hypothetical protein A3F31_01400 [Candidatus Levybacteria bacterium RIFCSPHIGHO2_12_FULL_38_12]|nr:MAG: hypothetical protein A3D75_00325 [Candidatus Levybacteria bacterium RIFCSPHIGHO2_02_FULL_37_18]OGH22339.1 MAG: hypothetical protein A3F31_01400 [Candidatus Levybacteria bacterium RIFCSPHIGHO2_12_FULL_38_12]OGH34983.1 MAG: hypothetical protein A3A47_03045 [Candidatus Levybacteria bacterium RIFCSPLOWO2_01_FULL_37_20]